MPTSLTETDIINYALTKLGERKIGSRTEQNERARVMDLIYDANRDKCLREAPWNFAITRATIAADAEAPEFGWAAKYTLPNDMLYMLATQYDQRYSIEKGFILSDIENSLKIVYVAKITDASRYDSSFVEMLASRLAWQAATKLTENSSQAADLRAEYMQAKHEARKFDGQEDPPKCMPETGWNKARVTGSYSRGKYDYYTGNGAI